MKNEENIQEQSQSLSNHDEQNANESYGNIILVYLNDYDYPEYDDYDEDYDSHYDEYSGSYAQDEMGYSDEDIDDVFDGDPDAYWNID